MIRRRRQELGHVVRAEARGVGGAPTLAPGVARARVREVELAVEDRAFERGEHAEQEGARSGHVEANRIGTENRERVGTVEVREREEVGRRGRDREVAADAPGDIGGAERIARWTAHTVAQLESDVATRRGPPGGGEIWNDRARRRKLRVRTGSNAGRPDEAARPARQDGAPARASASPSCRGPPEAAARRR